MIAQQDMSEEEPITEAKEYQRVIGSLQYLILTRLDIQYAVNKLAQFMCSPKPVHWIAMKKVLHYLAGTQSMGITLNKSQILN